MITIEAVVAAIMSFIMCTQHKSSLVRGISLILGLIATAIAIGFLPPMVRDKIFQSPDTVRVENNRTAIEECRHNTTLCVNGFVRWAGAQIVKISDCADECRPFEVGYSELIALAADKDFAYFGDVTLPNEHPEWETAREKYIEQLLRRPH
ncbi:MAG: hypothetical protein NUV60_02330 [Patescibacteria group bacterium]|nr:hypothetical protein [Patescibacteria group bacterium]